MGTTGRRRWGTREQVMAAAFAAIAALWACADKEEETIEQPPTITVDCQQDSVFIIVRVESGHQAKYDTVTAGDMPLVRRIANLPEYHDCQRFVVPPSMTATGGTSDYSYGPLVAIWTADSLQWRFGGPEAIGPSMAVPLAVIYNFVGPEYTPLKIAPGFSCLYLWHDGGKPRHWQAAIVPLGNSPGPCAESMDPRALGGSQLDVRVASLPAKLRPSDIPNVTRWDWDPELKQQYIGIRCGDEWCEIGHTRMVQSRNALSTGVTPARLDAAAPVGITNMQEGKGTDREKLRVVGVKGWYDEQFLDTIANGKPALTNIAGTVIPHPALERAGLFQPGEWRPSAFMSVTADYPGKVPLKAGLSTMYLCKEYAGECQVPAAPAAPAPTACPQEPPSSTTPNAQPARWWAKIVSENGEVRYHCITRRSHSGRAIPAAAARWNWNEMDAKTWVACEGGCCTVN